MSIKHVSQEINRFLSTLEPEVLCIMGKWGVGKTFAWNTFLKEAIDNNRVKLTKYSYVSLFGCNSLEAIKTAIFENTLPLDRVAAGPSPETIEEIFSTLKAKGRFHFLAKVWRELPKLNEFNPGFSFFIRKQIICIDDLERVGKDVSTNDVLGLVSELKEQRKCKVILLLNDEVLEGEAQTDFKNQLEKVADVEMKFVPTSSEAVEIGVDKTLSFNDKLSRMCVALNIVNIRVIKKIERLLKRLNEILVDHDKRILDSALSTVVLLGWAKYEPKFAPPVDFVKTHNRYGHLFEDKNKKPSSQELEWRRLINNTDFVLFDEFDQLVLESIEKGYFDIEAIGKGASLLDERNKLQDQENSFSEAWKGYRHSFESNQEDVLKNIFDSFKKSVQSISPSNADGTITLFRKFGKEKEADELVEYYMDQRIEGKEFYDPTHSVFLQIKDLKLKAAFEDKVKSFKDVRSPSQLLIKIAQNSGWNPEDISLLAALSVDDYYAIFKEFKGDDLHVIVNQALRFKQYSPPSEEMNTISKNAEDALKKIAKESKINRYRVASYGVEVEEDEIKPTT